MADSTTSLTPADVRVLEAWMERAYPTEPGNFRRVMPPEIAAIVSKLCDRFWQTINESRGEP